MKKCCINICVQRKCNKRVFFFFLQTSSCVLFSCRSASGGLSSRQHQDTLAADRERRRQEREERLQRIEREERSRFRFVSPHSFHAPDNILDSSSFKAAAAAPSTICRYVVRLRAALTLNHSAHFSPAVVFLYCYYTRSGKHSRTYRLLHVLKIKHT